ncbi:uncharacterized protein [Argopecten irradians]|uniref:uncharacterized protein isoform X2 n=1 Tax=Argopecten irradians TaxID=31199 RepID=UPI00371A1C10
MEDLLRESLGLQPKRLAGYHEEAVAKPPSVNRTDMTSQEWTQYLQSKLGKTSYIKLKPNPEEGFDYTTETDMITPAWLRYLPDVPGNKFSMRWEGDTSVKEEEEAMRRRNDDRNKIYYDLLYKKDYSKTGNESLWFNVEKKHRATQSLHDIVLTRTRNDDVTGSVTSSYCA